MGQDEGLSSRRFMDERHDSLGFLFPLRFSDAWHSASKIQLPTP